MQLNLQSVPDTVKRLYQLTTVVNRSQLPAQAFDMAIDGAIIDVCFFVVRCVHELIPALNDARVDCKRLQDQKFRDGERNRLALPATSLALRVYVQMTPWAAGPRPSASPFQARLGA